MTKQRNPGHHLNSMIEEWSRYADGYYNQFSSPIGFDSVLGRGWADIGMSLHDLLNGPTACDCGAASAMILYVLEANGVNPDTGELYLESKTYPWVQAHQDGILERGWGLR